MDLENKTIEQANEEALKILQESDNKAEAIVNALELITSAKNAELLAKIQEESERAKYDEEFKKSLNLRTLSKAETKFYQMLKDAKQTVTAEQTDIFPTSIIDRTLDDIKKESGVLNLVQFTPADVKNWLVAEKSGGYQWGGIFDGITGELSHEFDSMNVELNKLTVYMIIPKAIKDLSLPFVDKYFRASLKESLVDGAEYGYLSGTGKDEPVVIYYQIGSLEQNGEHSAKTLNTVTGFSPKELAPVKKTLSKNGKRDIDKIYLVCNPADEADYVAPALYDREGKMISSYKNLEVIKTANNPQGKAAFTLDKKYIMGFSGFKINEYAETKALDDANVLIGKAYANGRAVDDSVAYVIDVTKLEEYIPTIRTISETENGTENETDETQGA